MIVYSEGKKFAEFNGLRFCRDEKTGYYLNSTTSTRLHRCVWEYYNGKIPSGYEIHHIDHDKSNNEIDNLAMVTEAEHHKIHTAEMSDEIRNRLRENVIKNAVPAAAAWHGSEAGHEWHKKHFERVKDAFCVKSTFVCEYCGKEYETTVTGRNRFCSNNCKSAWRRKAGLDDEERYCRVCGKKFWANKYSGKHYCSGECKSRWRIENNRNKKATAAACL